MAQNIFRLVHTIFDNGGAIEPGATIEVYYAGTTTPIQLYSDRGLTTTAGDSVTADANGVVPERWIADNVLFKLIWKDADGSTRYTRDYANDDDDTEAADQTERIVANNAALTALTTATGLIDNGVYRTLGRSSERDGGEGVWVYDSASTTTATTGTVLAIDGGGAGRFFRLYNKEDFASIEWFGGNNDGATTNTAAYNAWLTAATAGTAPKTLRFGNGTYLFSTKPDKIEDVTGIRIIGSDATTVKVGYSSADKTSALFHWYGASSFGRLEAIALGTADTFEGGSLFRVEAKAGSAPDFWHGERLYLTSYGNVSAKTISAATAAAEGVFTATAHGLSAGDRVVLVGLSGGTWNTLNDADYTVAPSPAADTFKLYAVGTTTFVDTSTLGTYSASTGTVKRGMCADVPMSFDGTARSSPLGLRGVTLDEVEVFGGREWAADILGVQFFSWTGGAASQAGWTARINVSGTSGVPSNYTFIAPTAITGLVEDYSNKLRVTAYNEGSHTTTANTNTSWRIYYPNTDIIAVSGTANQTITNTAPRLRLVESDQGDCTGDFTLSGKSLLVSVDEANAASGSAVFVRDNGTNVYQVSAGGNFTYVTFYPAADGTLDIGSGSLQFKNAFLVNAATVSSDRRLKDNERGHSPAELAAAADMEREGITLYQLKEALAKKGADARWHTGVIAQDIAAILERHGLDPWRYDFMCKDRVEWTDPQAGLRHSVAEAQARLPALEAEIAALSQERDETLASRPAEGEERDRAAAVRDDYDRRIGVLLKEREERAKIATVVVPPAPPWFEPWDKLSIRYEPLILWLIKAQGERISRIEAMLGMLAAGVQ